MQKLVLSIDEAAEALGVSRAHGFRLADEGVIPTVRLGRRRVVPIDALRRMLDPQNAAAGASKKVTAGARP